jgi:hypothetical protein
VLVVAQKAISKVEGRIVRLDAVEPSAEARELAGESDPRRIEVVLREAQRVVRDLGLARDRRDRVTASSAHLPGSTRRMRPSPARSSSCLSIRTPPQPACARGYTS